MYGVVLWSDPKKDRAVIWCEDHGNLAFFKGQSCVTQMPIGLEPGDLVRFELVEARDMRLAQNLELVAAEEYPTLAQDLRQAGGQADMPMADPVQSNIIPFGRKLSQPMRRVADKRSAG